MRMCRWLALCTCFGILSMLFRSRNSCMMPLGTPPGIFVRTLRARLSWTSPFRSLKVFVLRSLSDSWETRDEIPQFRVTDFRGGACKKQEQAIPGCCTGQALSGLSFCWRLLLGSWKWSSYWGGAVLGLQVDLKVSPSAGFSPSTGTAATGSSETPAKGCRRDPSQWMWHHIMTNKEYKTWKLSEESPGPACLFCECGYWTSWSSGHRWHC